MQIKKLIGSIALIGLATYLLPSCGGCNKNQQPTNESSSKTEENNAQGADSLDYYIEHNLITWKGWVDTALHREFNLDSLNQVTVDSVRNPFTTVMTQERYDAYAPYFVYNKEKTMAIDMVSYGNVLEKDVNGKPRLLGGDPDSEVAILDVASKVRLRILFVGPSITIKEVNWINDHEIIIGGIEADEHGLLRPVAWKYNMETSELLNWSAN
ncbi:hypothetical protein LX64_04656 [Chitinophaga skermanii]|uniref:Uncharacterized protein n=1 Tax=Chitinophaga skermanii TaxID=331697 RepID=A0A327Q4L2_9BACT|nr:hypothetical protein [Chitinophaga skermanii]RAI98671.1 hypothetical protein LX64_04656 [Chitinophaga skermanii]